MSKVPTELDINEILKSLADSCVGAAEALATNMRRPEWKGPMEYVIPKMGVELKVELSSKDGKVKGLLGRSSAESTSSVMSSIRFDIVAVPRERSEG